MAKPPVMSSPLRSSSEFASCSISMLSVLDNSATLPAGLGVSWLCTYLKAEQVNSCDCVIDDSIESQSATEFQK